MKPNYKQIYIKDAKYLFLTIPKDLKVIQSSKIKTQNLFSFIIRPFVSQIKP